MGRCAGRGPTAIALVPQCYELYGASGNTIHAWGAATCGCAMPVIGRDRLFLGPRSRTSRRGILAMSTHRAPGLQQHELAGSHSSRSSARPNSRRRRRQSGANSCARRVRRSRCHGRARRLVRSPARLAVPLPQRQPLLPRRAAFLSPSSDHRQARSPKSYAGRLATWLLQGERCDTTRLLESARYREFVDAPDKNRTCARGLGNRCSIH
jgi:hypothetical protein